MNQLSDENVQNMKCSQKNASTKNKNNIKAKDPPETPVEICKWNDKLHETLANTLHINKIHSNLTNGTSDHSKDSVNDLNEAQDAAPSEGEKNVNSVQCSDVGKTKTHENCETNTSYKVRCSKEIETESLANSSLGDHKEEIEILSYESELQMPEIMRLIQKDLSEPYSIYTYRYFIHNWPKLCFLASHEGKCIGAIVCKLDMHRNNVKRGYIAMLAVDEKYRKKKIGSKLVQKAIRVKQSLFFLLRVVMDYCSLYTIIKLLHKK